MKKSYQQLSLEERESIAEERREGVSLRAIARKLGRHPSTLSRELGRNSSPQKGLYRPLRAHELARARALVPRRRPVLEHPQLWRYVHSHLLLKWSPQQIAAKLKLDFPQDPLMRVSHETIYYTLYAMPRGELRAELLAALRQSRKRRRPRSRTGPARGEIPNKTSLHDRPEEVASRLVPGHWEGDLIKGARNASAIGVLVERTTLFLVLVRMDGTTADAARRSFARKMRHIPAPIRKSLTYDQGKEMAQHEQLARHLRLSIFFADPHSPWQRGICENTNGLLRQYFPKGTDLSGFSQRDLNRVALQINNRPRKSLGFLSPLHAFNLALLSLPVALLP